MPLPTGREEVEGRTKLDRAITEGGRREVKAQGSISKSFVHASRHVPTAETGPDAREVELFFFLGTSSAVCGDPVPSSAYMDEMQMSAAFIPAGGRRRKGLSHNDRVQITSVSSVTNESRRRGWIRMWNGRYPLGSRRSLVELSRSVYY